MPEDASLTVISMEKPSGYPDFSPPSGFVPPEGIEPGKPFPALVELQVKPDGKLCLVSIEGAKYPEESEDEYEEEEVEVEEDMEEPPAMENLQDERAFGDRLATLPMQ
jgi:hypothetical protein